jgi:hypothetical protein
MPYDLTSESETFESTFPNTLKETSSKPGFHAYFADGCGLNYCLANASLAAFLPYQEFARQPFSRGGRSFHWFTRRFFEGPESGKFRCCITDHVIVGASAPGPIRLFQLQRGQRHWLDTRSSSFPSMESPKWKRISDAKARVLIVDQIQPGVLQRTAVRFDLAKDKGIKRTSIFRTDFNDQLVLSTAFVDSCDFCGEWCHDRHSATLRGCELAKIESSRRRKWPNSLRIFR